MTNTNETNKETEFSVSALNNRLERDAIIVRAKDMRAAIAQIFIDAEYWNNLHTPWKEAVNPDPGGDIKRLADRLDKIIENERPNI